MRQKLLTLEIAESKCKEKKINTYLSILSIQGIKIYVGSLFLKER